MLARRVANVSRMLCRSVRRDCVRRSALACSALSSAKCMSSAAWTAAEVSSEDGASALSAWRNLSSSSRKTGCDSSVRAAPVASASRRP